VVIAGLIIFNTIRMAIFNRKEEIYMMKLIGAGKSFMRGPFIVEAMLYGLVAAVVAGGIVGGVMAVLSESIGEVMEPTVRVMMEWWWAGALGLVIVGMVIGWISAWLATKRYLRRM
jgi:cell division transport system permease protein